MSTVLRDKYGWPVETIKGRPITNFIRRVLHTNMLRTFHNFSVSPVCPNCGYSAKSSVFSSSWNEALESAALVAEKACYESFDSDAERVTAAIRALKTEGKGG